MRSGFTGLIASRAARLTAVAVLFAEVTIGVVQTARLAPSWADAIFSAVLAVPLVTAGVALTLSRVPDGVRATARGGLVVSGAINLAATAMWIAIGTERESLVAHAVAGMAALAALFCAFVCLAVGVRPPWPARQRAGMLFSKDPRDYL